MKRQTVKWLRCPMVSAKAKVCAGKLALSSPEKTDEIEYGSLNCESCKAPFPILAGVAIVVPDVGFYLCSHVKGVSRSVPDSKIPRQFLNDYKDAKSEIENSGMEDDLESMRVTALYLMNHYLRVSGSNLEWWNPTHGNKSPLIDELVKKYWDQGPFAKIAAWTKDFKGSVIELGCGVGGLSRALPKGAPYLGVDTSFTSIALARHLNLGTSFPEKIKIPEDLLQGGASREIVFKQESSENRDFIVGDLSSLPLVEKEFDLAIALNAIDMLDEPEKLPVVKASLLKKSGKTIQSCPYIWHESVSERVRKIVPKSHQESAKAVEWLYEKAGFKLENRENHVPWLFYKHARQLEVYSVHVFQAALVK